MKPVVWSKLWNHTKIEQPVTCLATTAYAYAACTVCVTIVDTGGKFRPVSNFTELHALTLATCFYYTLAQAHFPLSACKKKFSITHLVVRENLEQKSWV